MKTALIPPIPELTTFERRGIHLVLSHLLDDPDYWNFYRECSLQGDFLILDNGAHEHGAGEDPVILAEQALRLGASELVLPDALEDAEGTISRTTQAISLLEGAVRTFDQHDLRFMMVPQASTVFDWGRCLRTLVEAYQDSRLRSRGLTIGISKDYEVWQGGIHNLVRRYIVPLREDGLDFQVHLLGWGRQLHQLSSLEFSFPWIRSTDSAKPFVYAKHGVCLDLSTQSPAYPRRDPHYFYERLDPRQRETAWDNIKVFRTRAGDLQE